MLSCCKICHVLCLIFNVQSTYDNISQIKIIFLQLRDFQLWLKDEFYLPKKVNGKKIIKYIAAFAFALFVGKVNNFSVALFTLSLFELG